MYVDTMTLDEIKSLIISEMEYVHRKVISVISDSKYRKACLRMTGDDLRYFNRVDFTSKNSGIEYHIIISTYGKRDYLKNGLKTLTFSTFRRNNRVWVCSLYNKGDRFLFITPHFFDRYMERLGQCEYDNRLSLITDFFTKNRILSSINYQCPNHENSIFWSMDDGVGFGTREKEYRVLTTFVRKDMVFENQIEYLMSGERHITEKKLTEKYI
jgi:hypothetical protein